jgi:pimeloyl-ACP methyl ester carboxylesterase
MNTISVNGISLAYTRRGKGTPLMLIHGYPLDHTAWDEVTSLLKNEFDVIVLDLRGFGESTTVETPYTVSDMADDLAGLLDQVASIPSTLRPESRCESQTSVRERWWRKEKGR